MLIAYSTNASAEVVVPPETDVNPHCIPKVINGSITWLPCKIKPTVYTTKGPTTYNTTKDSTTVNYKAPDGAASYKVVEEDKNKKVTVTDYDTTPTGVHNITTNGKSQIYFYDSNGELISRTDVIDSSQVKNSRLDTADMNNVGKNPQQLRPDGWTNNGLMWERIENAASYDLYIDGKFVKKLDGLEFFYEFGSSDQKDKSATLIAKDASGKTISESSIPPPDFAFPPAAEDDWKTGIGIGGGGGDGGQGSCGDVCQELIDVMDCPEWDRYMGEWTNAIRNALPPPPNWDYVASVFVDHFANYFGDVPQPPSAWEIDQQIRPNNPPLDTYMPETNIDPLVPSDYNNKKVFDITTGPQISVVDESKPIEIYEPDKYIKSDKVGEFVYPADPRNSSDGIKQPDRINTGYNQPKPSASSLPSTEIPLPEGGTTTIPPLVVQPTDIPVPIKKGTTEGITPLPNDIGGIVPTPNIKP